MGFTRQHELPSLTQEEITNLDLEIVIAIDDSSNTFILDRPYIIDKKMRVDDLCDFLTEIENDSYMTCRWGNRINTLPVGLYRGEIIPDYIDKDGNSVSSFDSGRIENVFLNTDRIMVTETIKLANCNSKANIRQQTNQQGE